ncbi:MAG: hypothetical protein QXP96_06500 [Thermoproteota archaeon]
MISFVTTFKPFKGHFRIIQLNALRSWLKFCEGCEVIVVGQEEGVEEVAAKHDLKLIREVRRSTSGAPLLNDLLRKAESEAAYDYICLINGDIILLNDFADAFLSVRRRFKDFLMTARRVDVQVESLIDFTTEAVMDCLRSEVRASYASGKLGGADLFVFRKGLFDDVPPFVMGRFIWSRWLIFKALTSGVPAIDATPVMVAIHQTHDYSHIRDEEVKLAMRGMAGYVAVVKGSREYKWNLRLGGLAAYFSEEDCNYVLLPDGIYRRKDVRYLARYLIKLPILNKHIHPFALPLYKTVFPSRLVRTIVKRELFKNKLLY